MRRSCCLAAVVGLALVAPSRGVDWATIDRSLHKEPTYQSKTPLYCLLVFGPEAKTPVWVVLDRDVVYLDRNGNGDLTDPGERIVGEELFPSRPDVEVVRRFELVCRKAADPILPCAPEVFSFFLEQCVPRADWHDQAWVKDQQERPHNFFMITSKSMHSRDGSFRFGTSPSEAPILHYDGPRQFVLSKTFAPHGFRPGESGELAVELHTPGWNSTVRTHIQEIPESIHPVAEIEFPPGRPGDEPTRMRVELKDRC